MAKKFFSGQTSRFQDITGRTFGWLTVVKFNRRVKYIAYWKCKCQCGGTTVVQGGALRCGVTKSCGCYQKQQVSFRSAFHGYARVGKLHPAYRTWEGMMHRCSNKNGAAAHRYVLRGIRVCERWKHSSAFMQDMLPTWEKGRSLDRTNNDGNYSCGSCDECKRNGWPMNCRWATNMEQALNSSHVKWITWNGETRYQKDWARKLGIGNVTLSWRLSKGWSIERALTTPTRSKAVLK